jgi:transposase
MEQKRYTPEYRVEAVKLGRKIGAVKAARELGIASSTIRHWLQAASAGAIDTGQGSQTPETALTQAAEIQRLKADIKLMAKENARLAKENAFLEEASAFFAAARQRSARGSDLRSSL